MNKTILKAGLHITSAVAISTGSVVVGAIACVAVVGATTSIVGKMVLGYGTFTVVHGISKGLANKIVIPLIEVIPDEEIVIINNN